MDNVTRYIPIALFSAYIIKCVIQGAHTEDALVILGLLSLAAFFEYNPKQKRMTQIEAELKKANEEIARLASKIDMTQSSVAGLKLSTNMNPRLAINNK